MCYLRIKKLLCGQTKVNKKEKKLGVVFRLHYLRGRIMVPPFCRRGVEEGGLKGNQVKVLDSPAAVSSPKHGPPPSYATGTSLLLLGRRGGRERSQKTCHEDIAAYALEDRAGRTLNIFI